MMPAVGRQRTAAGKERSIISQPLSTESAQILRQNSLRKQRKAQKANALQK
jgi:hypothetical protein